MAKTRIEWADKTWNPIQAVTKGKSGRGYHCTKISPGCDNCYAEATNALRGNGIPFDSRATAFELVVKTLEAPLHWKKPRRVFVQSMGDLFHEFITLAMVDEVYKIMARCPQHTFMILTKRPMRMLMYYNHVAASGKVAICNRLTKPLVK
jgi:protein gp37